MGEKRAEENIALHSARGQAGCRANARNIEKHPGQDVEVIERAPVQPAPSTMPAAASSSSACTTANVALPSGPMRCSFRYSISVSTSELDGVMGYHVTTVTPANMQPRAAAALPSIMILPAVSFMRSIQNGSCLVKVASA